MNRTVNVDLIENWIDTNAPMGLEKLALKSGVSSHSIMKIKSKHSQIPRKLGTLAMLSKAIEVDIDVLFPATAPVNSAS